MLCIAYFVYGMSVKSSSLNVFFKLRRDRLLNVLIFPLVVVKVAIVDESKLETIYSTYPL